MAKDGGIADQSSKYETMMDTVTAAHYWEATGVSGYPLTSPIVGQSQFYHTFKHFIHLVDKEHESFAHVFAIVAEWGRGKSRLGYELIAQINDDSRGWFCRSEDGNLEAAELFSDREDRDK